MNGLEERVAKIEGTLEQIGKRLDSIDKRFESIDARLNHLSDKMDEKFNYLSDKIDSNFKSVVKIMLGILIPMWVSIIGAIIALFIAVVK